MDMDIKPAQLDSVSIDGKPVRAIPDEVSSVLSSAVARGQRTVVMTCGNSGSGKSTLAKAITESFPSFTRLSIDKYVFDHHGVHGKDFPPEMYEPYQDEAEAALKEQIKQVLAARSKDLVLDYSFWSKENRDKYRELVNAKGGGDYQVVLIFFQATEETLWARIEQRGAEWLQREKEGRGADGDPQYRVTRDVLRGYLRGFEVPQGEGEILVVVE